MTCLFSPQYFFDRAVFFQKVGYCPQGSLEQFSRVGHEVGCTEPPVFSFLSFALEFSRYSIYIACLMSADVLLPGSPI